jgi:hypothetical protein
MDVKNTTTGRIEQIEYLNPVPERIAGLELTWNEDTMMFEARAGVLRRLREHLKRRGDAQEAVERLLKRLRATADGRNMIDDLTEHLDYATGAEDDVNKPSAIQTVVKFWEDDLNIREARKSTNP